MTEIKSALEIAMERSKDIKPDKKAIRAKEVKTDGRKAVTEFLEGSGDIDLHKRVKEYPGEERAWYKEGLVEILFSHLSLPRNEEYTDKLKNLEAAFFSITKDKRQVPHLFQQIEQFFQQYLDTQKQVKEQLQNQFSPQLRQREAELSKQLGNEVKLTPEQLPEYKTALQRNLSSLDHQFQEALDQVKDQFKSILKL